jgi:AcrR family transcriptional regulator
MPGGSPVPRAKTSSTSGHSSAVAVGALVAPSAIKTVVARRNSTPHHCVCRAEIDEMARSTLTFSPKREFGRIPSGSNKRLDLSQVLGFTEAVTAARPLRNDRSVGTREALLAAAERLFAERGMYAVSNRQISEAAGQGNNAAVCYHFGTRTDLLRAIEGKHRGPIEELRHRMLAEIGDSTDLRDWVGCLVRPLTEHLDELGNPSWYARFAAQAMADPTYREVVTKDALASPQLVQAIEGINDCLPDLPKRVRFERIVMARNLLMHTCAEHEGDLAEHGPRARSPWPVAAEGLVDAIAGLWQAPVRIPSIRGGQKSTAVPPTATSR